MRLLVTQITHEEIPSSSMKGKLAACHCYPFLDEGVDAVCGKKIKISGNLSRLRHPRAKQNPLSVVVKMIPPFFARG